MSINYLTTDVSVKDNALRLVKTGQIFTPASAFILDGLNIKFHSFENFPINYTIFPITKITYPFLICVSKPIITKNNIICKDIFSKDGINLPLSKELLKYCKSKECFLKDVPYYEEPMDFTTPVRAWY